jgi:hypothetical protein
MELISCAKQFIQLEYLSPIQNLDICHLLSLGWQGIEEREKSNPTEGSSPLGI